MRVIMQKFLFVKALSGLQTSYYANDSLLKGLVHCNKDENYIFINKLPSFCIFLSLKVNYLFLEKEAVMLVAFLSAF